MGSLAVAVAVTVLVSACSGRPYVDSRREAGLDRTVGSSSPNAPVVCYNKNVTSPAEVQAMADAVCAESAQVARFKNEYVLECPLTQPWRATFQCVKPGSWEARSAGLTGWSTGAAPRASGDIAPAERRPLHLNLDDWEGGIYPDGMPPTPPRL